MAAASLSDYARAVPLNAVRALGFGADVPVTSKPASEVLRAMRSLPIGIWTAVESSGVTGRRVLTLLSALGGRATREQFAFQTAQADTDDLAEALGRLVTAGLVERGGDGSLALSVHLEASAPMASLGDYQAVNNKVLARICRSVGVATPIPTRKQDRVDAIAAVFADPTEARRVRDGLSADAAEMLDRIARRGALHAIPADDIGLESYLLRYAAPNPYGHALPKHLADNGALIALRELASHGIVGVAEWGYDELWIWREAWPMLERPFIADWPVVHRPAPVAVAPDSPRIPAIMGVLDQAMRAWEVNPPAVLKNGEKRVGKVQLRSTAKSIGSDEATVDLIGRLVIEVGLMLPNVVAESGRGRNRNVERAWMPDESMVRAWQDCGPLDRWARLFAEWCRPSHDVGHQLLHNRLLVIWELAALEGGWGYDDTERLAEWIAHRHGPIAVEGAVHECIADLRALGVVSATGPVALSALARVALERPEALGDALGAEATHAIVQADLTVIAPPDLRHDLELRLAALGDVESDSGATVYRLSPERITRAVQAGDTADEIVAFLGELSTVPLNDTVERLVRDAAARVGRVRVVAATTVVVVSDPVDLQRACSVKAAKLTALSDTVAVSDMAIAKVLAALERKGLAPDAVVDASARPRRSSDTEAAEVLARAAGMRSAAGGSTSSFMKRHAEQLESHARALADVSKRLAVTAPLAPIPSLVVGSSASASPGRKEAP